jgi:hypothetical protein
MRVASGPYALIRDAAALIRGAQDVLYEMLWIGPFGIRNRDAGDDGGSQRAADLKAALFSAEASPPIPFRRRP